MKSDNLIMKRLCFLLFFIFCFHSQNKITPQELIIKTKKSKKFKFSTKQKKFIKIIDQYRKQFYRTKNDIQKSILKERRAKKLQKLLKKTKIKRWVGKIKRLTTSKTGKIILSVEIGPNIFLETQKSDMSESFAKTNSLIKKNSKLYHKLVNLSEGTKIKLTGNFIFSKEKLLQEMNLGMGSSMVYPRYLFQFKKIKALKK